MPLPPNYNDWYLGGITSNTQNPFEVPYKNLSDAPGYSNAELSTGIGYTYSNNPTLANFGWQQIAQNDPQGIYNPNNTQGTSTGNGAGTDVDTATDLPSKWNWNTGLDAMNKAGKALGGSTGTFLLGASTIGKGVLTFKKAKADFAKGVLDKQGMKAAKTNFAGSTMGIASDMLSSFMPNKLEYNGKYGSITLTMDNVYDIASDVAMLINPLFGGIMKAGGFLSKGMNALGGGTDGMTKADSILSSSFFSLTPLGLINGFGGKKADTITRDNEAFAQVGSSYAGSDATVNDALLRSGKKYGLLSSGARNKANNLIAEAKRQQSIISDISSDVLDLNNLRNSMTSIYNNAYGLDLQGGYDLSAIRYGKKGMILKRTRNILKGLRGMVADPYLFFLQSLPKNLLDTSNYRMKDYWEFHGRPLDFNEGLLKEMFHKLKDGYHASSVAENPRTGEIEYMKAYNHPTRYMESDWYEKGLVYKDDGTVTKLTPGKEGYDDWKEFTSNYELQKTNPYWKYVRRKTPLHKNGGSITKATVIELIKPDSIQEFKKGGSVIELTKESFIELISPEDLPDSIQEFKKGGSVNVIPEGALHARKHNMDIDGITKKGIPVVSETKDGKIEQQAEIEKEEIIMRLEVTLKLEKLEKKYYNEETSQKEKDECALEAGKLLTEELLHNTKDNANLL